jgi:hypothetical protein
VTTYGATVIQPPNGSDRGFSATVATDTGAANDAAGLYGHFGGALAISSAAPAGVRGDSASRVGVYGLTDTGFGVAGGAGSGVGVQGYAGAAGIGLQAVNLDGGTALDINNGSIKVSGGVRAAFVATIPAGSLCTDPFNHPLLNDDPNALVFVTPQVSVSDYRGYAGAAMYAPSLGRWYICHAGVGDPGSPYVPLRMAVLVIKQ